MVYSAKSDDSNTISNFTRRKAITITTGGTSTPADYQVKLAITFEPGMQADFEDIRFNTRVSEYINYWIESYVASTSAVVWVELPDAITDPGSDDIWMYYGNADVSDGGVGADTFLSHFDGDSTGWTEVDPNSHIAFANNRIEFTNLNRVENAYVYQSVSVNGDVTIEYTFEITAYSNPSLVTFGSVGDIVSDHFHMDNGLASFYAYFQDTANDVGAIIKRINDVETYGGTVVYVEDTQYWIRTTIDRSGNGVTKVYSNAARTSQVGSDSILDMSDLSATLQYMYLISSYNTATIGAAISGWIDDFRVRKYITNEPTPSYGTVQHQRRTPQFIG